MVRGATEEAEEDEEEETIARAGGTFTRQCVEDAHARELASHGSFCCDERSKENPRNSIKSRRSCPELRPLLCIRESTLRNDTARPTASPFFASSKRPHTRALQSCKFILITSAER